MILYDSKNVWNPYLYLYLYRPTLGTFIARVLITHVDDLLFSVNELNKFFPALPDKLAEVENLSSRVPIRTNMSDSIMRIKDMIEQTRDMANRVSTGTEHVWI